MPTRGGLAVPDELTARPLGARLHLWADTARRLRPLKGTVKRIAFSIISFARRTGQQRKH